MQYKTLTLGLLQEEFRPLHDRLKSHHALMGALDQYAQRLKFLHDYWVETYTQANPQLDTAQVSGIALEEAVQDLPEVLRSDSPASPPDDATFSLDAAMAYLRQHTPPA
jgi:hypothetical protein